ncbi:MAG: Crp/Fnr family transcriptional regulator [Cyclobacteriaceae bacterium]|nr:Crp/Fnr family transcriptional regulator [Cyclobacteriaceae bacterium HetDA_MAG_MS6]
MKHFEHLKAAFQGVDFTPDLEDYFLEHWKEKTFKRHEFITEVGKRERYFYFILSGVQVLYVISKKGEKVVLGFTFKHNFSGVYDAMLRSYPSNFFLEVISDTTCLRMSAEAFNGLFTRFPGFERWARIFIENIFVGRTDRELEMLMKSAEERFVDFMKRCPEELRQIPQKYLASYLNMKPETFSRLRASVKY